MDIVMEISKNDQIDKRCSRYNTILIVIPCCRYSGQMLTTVHKQRTLGLMRYKTNKDHRIPLPLASLRKGRNIKDPWSDAVLNCSMFQDKDGLPAKVPLYDDEHRLTSLRIREISQFCWVYDHTSKIACRVVIIDLQCGYSGLSILSGNLLHVGDFEVTDIAIEQHWRLLDLKILNLLKKAGRLFLTPTVDFHYPEEFWKPVRDKLMAADSFVDAISVGGQAKTQLTDGLPTYTHRWCIGLKMKRRVYSYTRFSGLPYSAGPSFCRILGLLDPNVVNGVAEIGPYQEMFCFVTEEVNPHSSHRVLRQAIPEAVQHFLDIPCLANSTSGVVGTFDWKGGSDSFIPRVLRTLADGEALGSPSLDMISLLGVGLRMAGFPSVATIAKCEIDKLLTGFLLSRLCRVILMISPRFGFRGHLNNWGACFDDYATVFMLHRGCKWFTPETRQYSESQFEWWYQDDIAALRVVSQCPMNKVQRERFEHMAWRILAFYDDLIVSLIKSKQIGPCIPSHIKNAYGVRFEDDYPVYVDWSTKQTVTTFGDMKQRKGENYSVQSAKQLGDAPNYLLPRDRLLPDRIPRVVELKFVH